MAAAKYDFVIAGAGIAALSTARYIARLCPASTIALVTPHAPMSQTSSLSTECYRDHWPSRTMRAFMSRSISLIHEHAQSNAFRVTPLGYLYCSTSPRAAAAYAAEAEECHGAGATRAAHAAAQAAAWGCAPFGFSSPPARGADVYASPSAVQAAFPYLASGVQAALHTRNCGWVSAQTMGMDMLDTLLARRGGGGALTTLIRGHVVGGEGSGSRLGAVRVQPLSGAAQALRVECGAFVNASGPFLASTHRAVTGAARHSPGELPIRTEVHSKVIFRDVLGVIPRDTPQVILAEPAVPLWDAAELEYIADTHGVETARRASSAMPSGAHFRPYGGAESNAVLMLWEAWHHGVEPCEPPPDSADQYLDKAMYPEIVLRGLANLVPGLRAYFEEAALAKWRAARGLSPSSPAPSLIEPITDGGYYTKTEENHPLIGPTPGPGGVGRMDNAFTCGAVSGYGIMAGHAAGELCALHATGASALPEYAGLMSPLRYQDEGFMRKGGTRDQLLAAGGGQL